MRSILCQHCGAPIVSRQSLAVGGRTLQPFHTRCYTAYAAVQPWYRKPGWPANRWASLLPFNALLLGLVLVLDVAVGITEDKQLGIALLLLLSNLWLLLARLVSFVSLERHLPSAGR